MPAHVKTAAIITILAVVANNFTAGKGTVYQGIGLFAAAYGGLWLSAKF